MELSLFLPLFLLFGGFVPLIFGANRLVGGASDLARRFGVPPLVVGLTIVAFGTSAPELVVNLLAATSGETSLALSNVVGSNIFNLLGILGLSALIVPLKITDSTVRAEVPLMVLSALVLPILALDALWGDAVFGPGRSVVGRADGLILLLFFAVFLFYSADLLRAAPKAEGTAPSHPAPPPAVSAFWIVVGLALLILGGKMIVDGATALARGFGVSERIIGLTIVAVGTSLPELATSLVAALKKEPEIAVGNVVGSNIFNAFFILGLTATIVPIPVGGPEIFDLLVNLAASLLLLAFAFLGRGRQVSRWEGGLYLVGYAGYLTFLLST